MIYIQTWDEAMICFLRMRIHRRGSRCRASGPARLGRCFRQLESDASGNILHLLFLLGFPVQADVVGNQRFLCAMEASMRAH